jgi:putative methyltransferase (TIGR04325 family)
LQYLEDPGAAVKQIAQAGIKNIIIDKTVVHNHPENRLMIQQVPSYIYKASYPVQFFNEDKLISLFQPEYKVLAKFDYPKEYNSAILSLQAGYKGFILQLTGT